MQFDYADDAPILADQEVPETPEVPIAMHQDLKHATQLIYRALTQKFPERLPQTPVSYTVEDLTGGDSSNLEFALMGISSQDAYIFDQHGQIDCLLRVLLEQWDEFEDALWERYKVFPFPFHSAFLGHANQHLRMLVQTAPETFALLIIPVTMN